MSTADILRLNTLRPEVREHPDSAKAHSQEAHNTAASALARSSVRHAEPEVEILVERLFFPTGVQSPRVVMVAEVERATNKDCVAGKIAEALARRVEQPVCAVEADFLSPSLAEYFEAGYGACLAEARYLMPQIPQFVVSARQGNLSVLTRASTAASIDPSSAIHSCLEGLSHESGY